MASLCSGVGAFVVLFFKQKTAYEMRISDWSSDVCSSDLHRIRDVGDLGSYVPNVVIAEGTGLGSAVVIRGVGASTRNIDRKSVVSGKRVSVRVDLGGRRIIKKQTKKQTAQTYTTHHTAAKYTHIHRQARIHDGNSK